MLCTFSLLDSIGCASLSIFIPYLFSTRQNIPNLFSKPTLLVSYRCTYFLVKKTLLVGICHKILIPESTGNSPPQGHAFFLLAQTPARVLKVTIGYVYVRIENAQKSEKNDDFCKYKKQGYYLTLDSQKQGYYLTFSSKIEKNHTFSIYKNRPFFPRRMS